MYKLAYFYFSFLTATLYKHIGVHTNPLDIHDYLQLLSCSL